MKGRAPRILERTPAALAGDELPSIFTGAISGVLVRGFLSPAAAAGIVRDVRASVAPMDAAPFPGVTYGAVLVVSPPDLGGYRQAGRALAEALAPSGATGAVRALFAAMGARPENPSDYAALTVRALAPGQSVAAHSERSDWPSMAALAPLLDPATTLSFYVPLALGDSGGELVVYHRPPAGMEPPIGGAPPDRANAMLARFGETRLRPGVGDLLIFDGGRFNHRVTPVGPGRDRWTMGGFAAMDRGGQRLLFWS